MAAHRPVYDYLYTGINSGPMLGNEYGKPLPFLHYNMCNTYVQSAQVRHVLTRITHFYLSPTCLSTNGKSHPAFTPQPQSITVLWLILISRPAEGRRLSWPGWLVTYWCDVLVQRWARYRVTLFCRFFSEWEVLFQEEYHLEPAN